jgi:hypothetical protein
VVGGAVQPPAAQVPAAGQVAQPGEVTQPGAAQQPAQMAGRPGEIAALPTTSTAGMLPGVVLFLCFALGMRRMRR